MLQARICLLLCLGTAGAAEVPQGLRNYMACLYWVVKHGCAWSACLPATSTHSQYLNAVCR